MHNEICPVCQSKLIAGCQPWHMLCGNCGYEKADLQSAINLDNAHQLIDEDDREAGLRELRTHNFHRLLADIISLKPQGGRLLEVGCAHGWFLEAAKNYFEVFGIEPDKKLFEVTVACGLSVRMGYFPNALARDESFDVIVFNDVFEHISDIAQVLASCHQHLNLNGLLVLNLPSSDGVFYKLSNILCRCGYSSFFERLWQKDLPSPHLHYFNLNNLTNLLKFNKFDPKLKGNLSTLRLNGLYTRIIYTGNRSVTICIIIYIIIALFLPILRVLPSDIFYVVAKRN